jgi:hypothetical protein
MTTHIDQPAAVTRHLVPEDQRLTVVEKLFGIHFPLRLEPVIFGQTQKMTQGAYSGGYWQFYTLDNGGFYMAPDGDEIYQVVCDNYWQGKLSADALGIVSCLYAYSHLSCSRDLDFARICAEHYHLLREFMMDHDAVANILGAID